MVGVVARLQQIGAATLPVRMTTRDDRGTEAAPPWTEPARGGYPEPALAGLTGAEQLQAMLDGHTPRPPISRLTGMRLVEAGTGTAVFELPLSEWLRSPQGAISVGPLTLPADGALACALQSALPPATPFTTSELSLRVLAPARPGTTAVASGRLVHARRTLALSEVSITDEHGRLLAHGSSLCFIAPQLTPVPAPPTRREPVPQSTDPSRDPWMRAPMGDTIPQQVWDERSGLEVLEALVSGELGPAPLGMLTGLHPVAVSPGAATFAMPATEWLCAPPRGRAQGGTVAVLAETALSGAIQTTQPAGTALAPVDLKVNYLRPLATDGREALAHGRVIHAGRRIAVANSEVRDADRRLIAVATGSAMVLPGRAASLATMED